MQERPEQPIKKELPRREEHIENVSLSEQDRAVQEVFELNPELKEIACNSLGIENDKDIVIELGRSKDETNLGKIQNINVYYKGELILNSDDKSQGKKLILVTQKDGTSYVGDILLPEELQGKGLGAKILQKVSNELNTKIVPSNTQGNHFTSPQALKMWEKIGNEILPNQEAEKLYAKYLETIFPESKIKDIVWHGTRSDEDFEEFNIEKDTKEKEGAFFSRKAEGSYLGGTYKTLACRLDINPYYVELKDRKEIRDAGNISEALAGKGFTGIEWERKDLPNEIQVFEPEQIHILGSKEDIEKFKEFVIKEKSQ